MSLLLLTGGRKAQGLPVTTLVGTVDDILHARESWAVVAFVVTEDGDSDDARLAPGRRLRVSGGMLGRTQPGEKLRIDGEAEDHPRYGFQFTAQRMEALGIATNGDASAWLTRLNGVGPVLAGRIAEHFGDQLLAVMQNPPAPGAEELLLEVDGISTVTAKTIRESWGELGACGSPEDLAYLEGELGLSRWETNQVLAHAMKAKKELRGLLEREPYSLMEIKGLGFRRVDVIARKAGCARHAPMRLEAAVLWHLGEVTQEHCLEPYGKLVRGASEAVGVREPLIAEAVERLGSSGRVLILRASRRVTVHNLDLYKAERHIMRLVRIAEESAACPSNQPAPSTTTRATPSSPSLPPEEPTSSARPAPVAAPSADLPASSRPVPQQSSSLAWGEEPESPSPPTPRAGFDQTLARLQEINARAEKKPAPSPSPSPAASESQTPSDAQLARQEAEEERACIQSFQPDVDPKGSKTERMAAILARQSSVAELLEFAADRSTTEDW